MLEVMDTTQTKRRTTAPLLWLSRIRRLWPGRNAAGSRPRTRPASSKKYNAHRTRRGRGSAATCRPLFLGPDPMAAGGILK